MPHGNYHFLCYTYTVNSAQLLTKTVQCTIAALSPVVAHESSLQNESFQLFKLLLQAQFIAGCLHLLHGNPQDGLPLLHNRTGNQQVRKQQPVRTYRINLVRDLQGRTEVQYGFLPGSCN